MQWYQLETEEVLNKLNTTRDGLPSTESEKRVLRYGKNKIDIIKPPSFLKLLLTRFTSFLPWLLVALAVLAFSADYFLQTTQHFFDGIIIVMILVINALLGAYQDFKSGRALNDLDALNQIQAVVLRDRKKQKVFATELVPGDIIYVSEGMKVPADCRIIQTHHLDTDEAMLTGESHNHTKTSIAIPRESPLVAQLNMLFMHTHVTHGKAMAVVVKTGAETQVGKIGHALRENTKSPFTKELDIATNNITLLAISLILIVVFIFFVRGQPITQILLMASALLIGTIPEGLPTIVTFSLAAAQRTLQQKKVLVKRNTLLETLGGVDVICTDKTGTITCNKLAIKKIFVAGESKYEAITPRLKEAFARSSLLPNEVEHTQRGYVGDPIDIAFIDYFNDKDLDILKFRSEYPLIHLKPFSPHTKTVSSTHSFDEGAITYAKGAPEVFLEECTHIATKKGISIFTNARKKVVEDTLIDFSKQALRNVALGYKVEDKFVFVGIVGLLDPPKEGISTILQIVYSAGIEVKMITGDSKETAIAVATAAGFKDPRAIDWLQMRDLSVGQLSERVEQYNIFCRMSPENKLTIVKAIEENGHKVAITGDGVNDAPALQEATVGIAMGSQSEDIAKDAADLIVLSDDFGMIVEGIRQGRTIFYNIRKVLNYLLTSNLGEILLVIIGSFIGIMPFLPIQLLWVNFIANYAPALALGIDPPIKGIMKKKPTGIKEKLINNKIITMAIYIGLKKVLFLAILFYGSYYFIGDLLYSQTIAFTWLVMWHFVRVTTIRVEEGTSLFSNKYVFFALLLPVFFQFVILYTPISSFFRVVPLDFFTWIILILFTLVGIYTEHLLSGFIQKRLAGSVDEY